MNSASQRKGSLAAHGTWVEGGVQDLYQRDTNLYSSTVLPGRLEEQT